MAKYDTLPIYKAVYDFLLKILKFIAQFPREYKYTIGDKIQGAAVAITGAARATASTALYVFRTKGRALSST